MGDVVGTLGVGREADIAVLEMRAVDIEMEDCQSQLRRVTQRLLPAACWRAGARVAVTTPEEHVRTRTVRLDRNL